MDSLLHTARAGSAPPTAVTHSGFRLREWAPVYAAFSTRCALLLLVVCTRGPAALIATDTESYIIPGRTLLHGHFGWPIPEINRTPGYPLFAVLTGMWGNHPVATAFAQILIDCLSAWLVMRIARQLFRSNRAGTLAGYLYAFEPLAILSTCAILSDSLYVATLLAMITVLLEYGHQPRWRHLLHAALWLGASAYVRPSSYYLPFVLAAYLLLWPRRLRFAQRCRASAAFLLVCMSLLAVWQVRNSIVAGYRGFSSIAEKELYFYLAAGVQANLQHRDFEQVQKDLGFHDEAKYLAAHPGQLAWTRAQRFAFMRRDALHTIASHPILYARLHLTGMAVVLFVPPAIDYLRLFNLYPEHGGLLGKVVDAGRLRTLAWILLHRPAVFFLMIAMFILLMAYYACALRGVAGSRASGRGLLLCIAAYFVLIAGGPHAVARYRMPLVPVICIFGGAGPRLD
jgi:4-amino-4-deoxy-L-arabinose transferase-like glycosyltransferase